MMLVLPVMDRTLSIMIFTNNKVFGLLTNGVNSILYDSRVFFIDKCPIAISLLTIDKRLSTTVLVYFAIDKRLTLALPFIKVNAEKR